jgi:hypothetical protein
VFVRILAVAVALAAASSSQAAIISLVFLPAVSAQGIAHLELRPNLGFIGSGGIEFTPARELAFGCLATGSGRTFELSVRLIDSTGVTLAELVIQDAGDPCSPENLAAVAQLDSSCLAVTMSFRGDDQCLFPVSLLGNHAVGQFDSTSYWLDSSFWLDPDWRPNVQMPPVLP